MIVKPINEVKANLIRKFECGNNSLDEYLWRYARQNEKKHLSRTYVLLDNDCVLGYVTLCNTEIDSIEDMELFSRLPKYPIPGIKIARLAIAKKYQKKHLGQFLLRFAFEKIIQISYEVGTKVIVVEPKCESVGFYTKYGFKPLIRNNLTYVIPIETVLKATRLSK